MKKQKIPKKEKPTHIKLVDYLDAVKIFNDRTYDIEQRVSNSVSKLRDLLTEIERRVADTNTNCTFAIMKLIDLIKVLEGKK